MYNIKKKIMQLKITLFILKKTAPCKTKFSDKWLERSTVDDEDSQAYSVSIWCENFS